jgi:2-C-methyl-D-erythritol 2,4-cyclodiphosphate synthase
MQFKIGQGFDFHPLVNGTRFVLGGVEIPFHKGLQGHSDADVATHALANAILGALGKGDLGRHFPDTDPQYKNADSVKLLGEVWRLATDENWKLVNADLTIFAQAPRLSPYLDAMRNRLAPTLAAKPEQLNIKASSPEGLGALGRGEGIASSAIVLLTSK